MKDTSKTKTQLITELAELRRQVAEMETTLADRRSNADRGIEAEIRDSEQKYRSIFNESRDGILLVDYDTGRIVDCNPEFERQTGRTLAQLRQMMVWDLRPPEQVEMVRQRFPVVKEQREA